MGTDIIWLLILRLLQRCNLQIMPHHVQFTLKLCNWISSFDINSLHWIMNVRYSKDLTRTKKNSAPKSDIFVLPFVNKFGHCLIISAWFFCYIHSYTTSPNTSKHKNAHFTTKKHKFLISTKQVAKLIRSQVLFRNLRQLYVAISQQLESLHLGSTYVACHTSTMGSSPDVLCLISDMASLSLVVENVIRLRWHIDMMRHSKRDRCFVCQPLKNWIFVVQKCDFVF